MLPRQPMELGWDRGDKAFVDARDGVREPGGHLATPQSNGVRSCPPFSGAIAANSDSAIEIRPFGQQFANGRDALGGRAIQHLEDVGYLLLAGVDVAFIGEQFGRNPVCVLENEVADRGAVSLGRSCDHGFSVRIDADAQAAFLVRGGRVDFRQGAGPRVV